MKYLIISDIHGSSKFLNKVLDINNDFDKLIILGALGYFIFPFDIVADILPLVGLSDDAFIIIAALTKVYSSITDEMKAEGKQMAAKILKKD